MGNVHALRPIAAIPARLPRYNTVAVFANYEEEQVENQVNVYHVPCLVNNQMDIQFDFQTFLAILSAQSI